MGIAAIARLTDPGFYVAKQEPLESVLGTIRQQGLRWAWIRGWAGRILTRAQRLCIWYKTLSSLSLIYTVGIFSFIEVKFTNWACIDFTVQFSKF